MGGVVAGAWLPRPLPPRTPVPEVSSPSHPFCIFTPLTLPTPPHPTLPTPPILPTHLGYFLKT